MNSSLYTVVSENQLTEILSHYDTNYVMSIVDSAIQSRFDTNAILSQPNIVAAWEQNFKQLMTDFEGNEDYQNKIMKVRVDTYREIISKICTTFNLRFTIEDAVDWYSAAFYLYDFFVANFNTYLISFFKGFIYRERAGIYDAMDMTNLKKNKDSSTLYGKKIYKDIRLAVINANISSVVDNICSYDINLFDIVDIVYTQPKLVQYMASIISDTGDFFHNFYAQIMHASIRPILLTEIRISIQNMAVDTSDPSLIAEDREDNN